MYSVWCLHSAVLCFMATCDVELSSLNSFDREKVEEGGRSRGWGKGKRKSEFDSSGLAPGKSWF